MGYLKWSKNLFYRLLGKASEPQDAPDNEKESSRVIFDKYGNIRVDYDNVDVQREFSNQMNAFNDIEVHPATQVRVASQDIIKKPTVKVKDENEDIEVDENGNKMEIA